MVNIGKYICTRDYITHSLLPTGGDVTLFKIGDIVNIRQYITTHRINTFDYVFLGDSMLMMRVSKYNIDYIQDLAGVLYFISIRESRRNKLKKLKLYENIM